MVKPFRGQSGTSSINTYPYDQAYIYMPKKSSHRSVKAIYMREAMAELKGSVDARFGSNLESSSQRVNGKTYQKYNIQG